VAVQKHQRVTAVDYEVFFSKEVSITVQGNHGYLQHPLAEIYLVSIVSDNGFTFVGHPKDFAWESIRDHKIVSHNASFDQACYLRLQELGIAPKDVVLTDWVCSADCCAYHALPRSLKNAMKAVFGVTISKEVRDNMKGKMPQDLDPQGLADLHAYALDDSRECLALWQKLGPLWPKTERAVSQLNREIEQRGVSLDVEKLEWAVNQRLRNIMICALKRIPWVPQDLVLDIVDSDEKTKLPKGCAPLSLPAVKTECDRIGIPAPASMAATSEEFEEWLEEHLRAAPWVKAMRAYRRANMLRVKCITLLTRQKADGRVPVSYLYTGAGVTRRFSGTSGFNWQNLPRTALYGVNLRHAVKPRAGCVFVASDLSQIEARVGLHIVKDKDTLNLIREGMGPYEAHSRVAMGWTGGPLKKENPQMYSLAKARVLALSYGAGHSKFVAMAKLYVTSDDFVNIFGAAVSEEDSSKYVEYQEWLLERQNKDFEAWLTAWKALTDFKRRCLINSKAQVDKYRDENPLVTGMWRRLDGALKTAAESPEKELVLELPSGNEMRYRNLKKGNDGVTATIVRFGSWSRAKMYGALLFQNLCQHYARDVFVDHMVSVDQSGQSIVLDTHDEIVTEVPTSEAEVAKAQIVKIMSTAPRWCSDLPLDCEAEILTDHYKK